MTANAQWKYDTSYDTFDSYIDSSRISTEGGYKSILELHNLKLPQSHHSRQQHKSSTLKSMVDCQSLRIQIVAIYHYSEEMGKGNEIYSASYPINESDWKYPAPNGSGDKLIKLACTKIPSPVTPPIVPAPIDNERKKLEEERRQLAEERRKLEEEKRKLNIKPPVNNAQEIKRQRCINLGLAPNSADFQQCVK